MAQYEDCQVKEEVGAAEETGHEAYWLKKLSGDLVRSSFHYDYKETVSNVHIIDNVEFRFSGEMFQELLDFCGGSDLKLYEVLAASLTVLLHKHSYSGNKDIIIGAPVMQQDIGPRPVNTILPLRNEIEDNMTFGTLLLKVGQTILEAHEHKDFPVEDLPDRLNIPMLGDDFPLFDIALSMENIHDKRHLRHINVNMIFSFFASNKHMEGVVEYNASLFERDTVKKITVHLTNLLSRVLSNINIKTADIPILTEEEKSYLLYELNDTRADYPTDKTIPQLFEEQVEKTPGKGALVFNDNLLTYNELNKRANQLARVLREKSVLPDGIVPTFLDRSFQLVTAILSILKAGAGYLPIVVDTPPKRVHDVLEDSDVKLVISDNTFSPDLDFQGQILDIDDPSNYRGETQNPDVVNPPDGLVYVIYTSGSTGKPKGVMLEQRNLINLMFFQFRETNIDFSQRILQFASIGFDVSAQELFSTLLGGGTLCLTTTDIKLDAPRLFEYAERNDVSVFFMPPAFLNFVFANPGIVETIPASLKHIVAAGEALTVSESFAAFLKKNGVFLHNHYGPTESHVVTTLTLEPSGDIPDAPSIGKSITNNRMMILGRDNKNLQPLGIPGELYLCGVNVARGYSNRPEMTGERFMENPYVVGERMYKTGDLARWMPDGNIDFMGRIDFQVKIRGFRIEIGEIENQILKQQVQPVKETIVLARDEGGEKYLCAYLVAENPVDITVLETALSANLPDYMIPAYFVQIDKMPLTPNGKIDRRALPDPRTLKRKEAYIPPRNAFEEKLVGIWAEVLHLEKDHVSVEDDFFKLGGHSLKAAVMVTLIHKTMDVKMVMREIFDMPTIRKQAEHIKSAVREEYKSIPKAPEKEYYPQTSMQKRMYFMDQLEKNSILYNIQLMDVYCKGVDKTELETALRKLIQRHESLRTTFHMVDGEAVQKIHDYEEVGPGFKIEYYETTEDGMIFSDQEGKEWTQITGLPFQEIVEHFVRPFDLSKPPLLRAGIIKVMGAIQILMFDMHHIMSDGVSLVVLIEELWELYDGKELPPLPVQYKDFAEWLCGDEQKEEIKKQETFWLKEFSGEISPLNLPTDHPRPTKMTFDGNIHYFEIGPEKTQQLNAIAQQQGVSLYMLLLAAYNVLLSKLSGQEEIIVGTVTAGRGHADIQGLIGMFVETLALRNYPVGEKTFKPFLTEIKNNALAAFENQGYPFEELVSKVASRQEANRNPLFDVVFGLENEAERGEDYLLEVLMLDKTNPYNFVVKKSKFDMMLMGAETGEEIQFSLEYNVQLFNEDTIDRFIKYYKKIVSSICMNINRKIAEIEIISEKEKKQIVYEFNDTKADYPTDKTIIDLFEERMEKTPGNIAIKYLDDTLTYRRFNEKTNRLARILREKGVNPENLVGIMMERSIEMIVGIFSILKAGGAYLPIDPNYPQDRVRYLFKDSSGKLLLTQERFIDFARTVEFEGEIMNLEDDSLYRGKTENLPKVNTPEDMAYVIYTSGSTGKPKGVMIEHISAVNLLLTLDKAYPLEASDSYLYKTAFLFDVSVSEIFGWFWRGGRLVILKQGGEKDPLMIIDRIEEDKITHLNFVPSMFNVFVSMLDDSNKNKLAGLKYIFLAGEAIWPDSIIKFRALGLDVIIDNIYGPTEATVYASWYPVANWKGSGSVSIGKATDNLKLYILSNDEHAQPQLQPIGIAGELTISGIQLARGYLNRPELTTEKFVDNPFAAMENNPKYFKKIYHTGDLTRWHTDGNVEYMGRIDFQVKVRGFRIELGEIETQLSKIDGIKEGVVIVREDKEGEKYLCAYLVSGKELDIPSIRETLLKNMPAYMIPSYFVQMEAIPLNPSGKVDRKALPEPETEASTREYVAPSNAVEKTFADVWSEVLGIKQVGIEDNFFESGGDSIKTILVSAKLLKRGLSINVNDFFSYSTIRELAKRSKKITRIIDQGTVTGKVDLLPFHYWLYRKDFHEKHDFNRFVMLYNNQGFDETIVETVFTKLTIHHDALRMVYRPGEDIPTLLNRGPGEGKLFDMDIFDFGENAAFENDIEKELSDIHQGIDLNNGPLVKLKLFRTIKGGFLSIVIHQTVIDEQSWKILLEDFKTGYEQTLNGEEIKFKDKTDSFKEWASRLKEYADSSTIQKEMEYWKNIEEGDINKLPRDHDIGEKKKKLESRKVVEMSFDKETTEKLIKEANWAYNTEIDDILLTALAMTVKQWCGHDAVSVSIESQKKPGIIEDIDINRTVGPFEFKYPVIIDMKNIGKEELPLSLKKVKETLRRVPNSGVGYGILKYLTSKEKKGSINFSFQPEINFSFSGQSEE